MKHRQLYIAILFLLVLMQVHAKPQFGEATLFNDNWRFNLSDLSIKDLGKVDDTKWRQLNLPHDWTIEQTYSPDKASCTGYLQGGTAWYRKTFQLKAEDSKKDIYIYFEGIYNHSEVFLNGHSLGKRPNGYISFMYELTPFLNVDGPNVLSVRVDHSLDADSRWYSGSGIYRDVYLVTANPIHLDLWGVYFKTTQLNDKKASISIEASIKNSSTSSANTSVLHEIIDPSSNKVVAHGSKNITIASKSSAVITQSLSLKTPKRWSIEVPTLYIMRTTVKQNGLVIDKNEQKMGLRTLSFDPNKGFALNGLWTKVKGVCIHHDAGCLGSAVPKEVWRRRFVTLKKMGCNAIRLSHNPQAPDVYDLCDELGILVMDEAFDEWEYPKRKWLIGWNKGVPGFQGAADFFNEWSDKDLRDMILRDRNHASIIMWSIGNEVDYPNDPYSHPILNGTTINQPMHGGYMPDSPPAERLGGIAKRLAAIVRSLDTSRPVTAALAGVVMSNETDYPFALDITGYNYTEDRYQLDHEKYPERVIFGSENGHSMNSWKIVRDNDFVFGQFIWTGIDYLGESGRWPSRGFYSGFIDFGGFLKPRGYFRRALWSDDAVTYLGTYPQPRNKKRLSMDAWPIWNYNEGEMIRVVCYTNAPKSQLQLNGVQIGETKMKDDQSGILYWDIPYQQGKLEVLGLNEQDEKVCEYMIQSSDRPEALSAKSNLSSISKNGGLAQIVIQVLDINGNPVLLSEDEVRCEIDGPAKLLGLEASNNSDMGNYSDNIQRVYHGRLLAYIKATGEAGDIHITFAAPWLKKAMVSIKAIE